MKAAYRGIAYLIALGVVAQASFIALAWFDVISDLESGAVITEDFEYNLGHLLHAIVGMMVIPLLALLLVVTSFFTKIPGASKRAGLVFLAVFVQVALAIVAFSIPAIGALHGINAIVLLGTALYAARKATAVAKEHRVVDATVPAQGGASSSASTTAV